MRSRSSLSSGESDFGNALAASISRARSRLTSRSFRAASPKMTRRAMRPKQPWNAGQRSSPELALAVDVGGVLYEQSGLPRRVDPQRTRATPAAHRAQEPDRAPVDIDGRGQAH